MKTLKSKGQAVRLRPHKLQRNPSVVTALPKPMYDKTPFKDPEQRVMHEEFLNFPKRSLMKSEGPTT
jgi:hypothetical protein